MGVKTRYPNAFARAEEAVPGMPHLGHFWTVWNGNHLLGQGETEGDAWEDARRNIVAREEHCL